ncbi:MAG: signal peptidase I [Clostridia bacterium]|nr:signal peptidase I [Clostridia bacterium]
MYKIRNDINENIQREEKVNRRFLLFTAFLVAVLFVIFFLFTEVYFNVLVEGDSMKPTLESGDVLTVNTLKDVEKGNIIIVDNHGKLIIKRAIAVGHDRVKIKDGYVFVNGKLLEEDYILKQGSTDNFAWGEEDYVLGANEVFYLGDNREDSSDSRIYGTCTLENVKGVVEDWSLNPSGIALFFHRFLNFTSGVNS